MSTNKWNQIGENIRDSVLRAIESGDFAGLSQSVGDALNEAAVDISRGMDQVGREIERQAKAHGTNISNAAGARNVDSARHFNRDRSSGSYKVEMYEGAQKPQYQARYCRLLPGRAAGPAFLSVGIVGISMLGVAALVTVVAAVFSGISFALPIGLGIGILPFIWLVTKGARLTGRNRRFQDYVRIIGNRGYCAIEDLARATGKRKAYVQKDLQDMLRHGYFLEGHMDAQQTTLIVDHETYRQYEDAEEGRRRRETEEARWEKEKRECPDKVREILDEGESYINHVRACNEAIPGIVMSEKLAKLEDIMHRIFEQVKRQPESADELHKFMTYYLPTTTKLIDAYRDLDGQPEYGENVANTKKEIEDTLDTINEAFENLFDSLFENTAWDISSDISTMKVMLEQEGLTKNKDFE